MGSLEYLAPERATGRRPGPPSDLWSLGATLYTAVEGVSPFRRTSAISTMHAVVADPLRPSAAAGPLGPVIEALLVKDPGLRPDGAATQRMLDDVRAGRPGFAPPPPAARHGVAAPRTPPPGFGPPTVPPAAAPRTPPPGFGPPTAPPTTPLPYPGGVPRPARRRTGAVIGGVVAAAAVIGGGVAAGIALSGQHTPQHRADPAPGRSTARHDPTDSGTRGAQVQDPTAVPVPTPPAAESPTPAPTGSPSASAPAPHGPRAVVLAYYAAINSGDYHRAWELGGKNIEHGTYAKFKQGFAHTAGDDVTVTAVDGDKVTIRLDAEQDDGTHHAFNGTYTVRAGVITASRMSSA